MKGYEKFYEHVLELTEIEEILDKMPLEPEQRDYLHEVVRKTIHLEIMNFVLTEIPEKERELFLKNLERKPADQGLTLYLQRLIDNFDDRAKQIAHQVKTDFVRMLHDYLQASEEWLSGNVA